LFYRCSSPFIRHLLASFRAGQLDAQADTWTPGRSGGDHYPDWPAEVTTLFRTLLCSKPPSSYSACASELHRRRHFLTDRASVRRWAL